MDHHLFIRICDYLNTALPNFEYSIKHLANVIIFTLERPIIEKMLKKAPSPCFIQNIKQIICRQNQLLNLENQPIGVLISSYLNSSKAQNILNVKHMNENKITSGKITIPQLNTTTLHRKTKNLTWFRLRVNNHTGLQNELSTFSSAHCYNIITDTVSEVVYETIKLKNRRLNFEQHEYTKFMSLFNRSPHVDEVIFFSNCMDHSKFIFNKNVVFSNIFKFNYCILNSRMDTTIFRDNVESLIPLQIHSILLLLHCNFNTNHSNIIPPMGLLSSEKNHATLAACINNYYASGSPRDLLLLGKGTEIGGIAKTHISLSFKE
jgi:hypothetical protein